MKLRKLAATTAIGLALALPASSHATNGMFLIGFGAKSRAMGGVGVAYAQDSLSIAYNPANLSDIKPRFDLGADIFTPPRAVTHESSLLPVNDATHPVHPSDPSGVATSDWFLIPNIGYADRWDDKISYGIAVVGAGLQTEYDQTTPNTFFNFNDLATNEVGVELMQIQMLPSIAYKLNDTHTFGASLALGFQMFRAEGLQGFVQLGFASAGSENYLTNKDWDYSSGAGIRLGWKGHFGKLQIGANYSSKVFMSQFDDYSGLFAEGGRFNIPENYAIGIAYKATPKINVAFDIHRTLYSGVPSVSNPGPSAADPSDFNPLCPGVDTNECKLGGSMGMGFGWKDSTVFKLGADYEYSEKWIFRVGYNYGKSPIPEDQVLFNMLAPATPEHHITFGATYGWNRNIEISFNFMHAFENTIKGPTSFGPTQAPVDGSNASIAMQQNSFGASLGWLF